jgi:flagellar biosynthesis/type III secretory pathway M-ring protein FliF/YscJ
MKAQDAKNIDIPLHDIKPLVEIEEYSFYYFLATSALVLVVLVAVGYLIYKYVKNRRKFNIRKEHFKLLNKLDLNDTKQSAYAITLYGATFKDDSDRHKEMFENITNRLEMYKYKKQVDKFDNEVKGLIEVYKGMIDV